MTRAVDFTYTISFLPDSEDGPIFTATVKEFPDVATFEDYPTQAYWMAVDAVEGLLAMGEDMGHNTPRPISILSKR